MRMWFGLEIDVVGLPPLMKQYFRNRVTSLKRRINLGFINRRFILRLRYSSDEVAFYEYNVITTGNPSS